MRKIYLLRHGRPDFPRGARPCLGRTDLPLGTLGRMQACRIARWLKTMQFEAVYSSPLQRAVETARFCSDDLRIHPNLREMDCGDWDGLDFEEIQRRWPELYAERGKDLTIPMPNGETPDEVRSRAEHALRQILAETTGDALIVAHSLVIRSLLHDYSARIPYASVTVLGDPKTVGFVPEEPLKPALAEELLKAAAPGEKIEAHCRAVAKETLRIAELLPMELDTELLASAALLHDVARLEKRHAETGAAWLRDLGYEDAAAIIERHHDHDGTKLDEAAILYLADKCILEDRVVPLAERFSVSEAKCLTEAARAAHARRLEAAERLRKQVNTLCQTEAVR